MASGADFGYEFGVDLSRCVIVDGVCYGTDSEGSVYIIGITKLDLNEVSGKVITALLARD